MKDAEIARLPASIRCRDVRDPHLLPGDRLLLDFTVTACPGDIVLIKRADGVYKLAIAPAAGTLVAVVRVAD